MISGDIDPTVILADSQVDPNSFMFEGMDTDRRPMFSPQEAAKFFFAKERLWLPHHERIGNTVFDGKKIPVRRENNIRYYTLGDLELTAHALAQNGVLPGERLRATLQILKSVGHLYLYL